MCLLLLLLLLLFYYRFGGINRSVGERILKICQHLTKLEAEVCSGTFFRTRYIITLWVNSRGNATAVHCPRVQNVLTGLYDFRRASMPSRICHKPLAHYWFTAKWPLLVSACLFVCLSVCLCKVFLSRLWSDFDQTRTHVICLGLVVSTRI